MTFAQFDKLTAEEKEAYLRHLTEDLGAVKMNVCDLFDMTPAALNKYMKKNLPDFKFPLNRKGYETVRTSEAWQKEMERSNHDVLVRIDCFAYRKSPGGRKQARCAALTTLYCRRHECPFYKNVLRYQAENRKLYKNSMGAPSKEKYPKYYEAIMKEAMKNA